MSTEEILLDGNKIVDLVRAAGVEAEWGTTGGNILNITAGPLTDGHRLIALGPGYYGDRVTEAVFYLDEISIFSDVPGEEDERYYVADVGGRNEQDVADLLVAQVRLIEKHPGHGFLVLGNDELEDAGFDGSARGFERQR